MRGYVYNCQFSRKTDGVHRTYLILIINPIWSYTLLDIIVRNIHFNLPPFKERPFI